MVDLGGARGQRSKRRSVLRRPWVNKFTVVCKIGIRRVPAVTWLEKNVVVDQPLIVCSGMIGLGEARDREIEFLHT